MYAVVRTEALMETLGRQRCQEHGTSGACICEPYARFGRQPAMVLKGAWHFVGADEAWQMDVESLVVCASSSYSPILLFLCSFELSFSIRWIALVYHKLPIVMFCFIKGPKATQSRDHRLKPTKLGTQINLSCFYVVYFEYFLIAMKRWLRLKKATGRTQSQSERGHVGCSQQSYKDRLSQILGTHYDIICTECKRWSHGDLGLICDTEFWFCFGLVLPFLAQISLLWIGNDYPVPWSYKYALCFDFYSSQTEFVSSLRVDSWLVLLNTSSTVKTGNWEYIIMHFILMKTGSFVNHSRML